MITDQVSIFLNNEVGRLTEVTNVLGKSGINLRSFALSESSDFGILRIITDDNVKAESILRDNFFAVNLTKVVVVELGDTPGALFRCIEKVSSAGVSVEYMYAFTNGAGAYAVIRADDVNLCERIICEGLA